MHRRARAPTRRNGHRCRSRRRRRRPSAASRASRRLRRTRARARRAAAPRRGSAASCSSKSSQHGMLTTRARTPRSRAAAACASTARLTSEPVAMMIASGRPPSASLTTYAPRSSPRAPPSAVPARCGTACREKRERGRDRGVARGRPSRRRPSRCASAGRMTSELRDRAQRHQVLDRLVRRAVFAEADAVVREDEDRAEARSARRCGSRGGCSRENTRNVPPNGITPPCAAMPLSAAPIACSRTPK